MWSQNSHTTSFGSEENTHAHPTQEFPIPTITPYEYLIAFLKNCAIAINNNCTQWVDIPGFTSAYDLISHQVAWASRLFSPYLHLRYRDNSCLSCKIQWRSNMWSTFKKCYPNAKHYDFVVFVYSALHSAFLPNGCPKWLTKYQSEK